MKLYNLHVPTLALAESIALAQPRAQAQLARKGREVRTVRVARSAPSPVLRNSGSSTSSMYLDTPCRGCSYSYTQASYQPKLLQKCENVRARKGTEVNIFAQGTFRLLVLVAEPWLSCIILLSSVEMNLLSTSR